MTRCVRPDEQRQDARRVRAVGGLAEDAPAERDRRVGAEDRRGWQAPRRPARDRRFQLGPRHALDVGGGKLARLLRLECLDVLVGAGEQQLVTHADLLEQLAPARALRSEVDERHALHRAQRSFAVIGMIDR